MELFQPFDLHLNNTNLKAMDFIKNPPQFLFSLCRWRPTWPLTLLYFSLFWGRTLSSPSLYLPDPQEEESPLSLSFFLEKGEERSPPFLLCLVTKFSAVPSLVRGPRLCATLVAALYIFLSWGIIDFSTGPCYFAPLIVSSLKFLRLESLPKMQGFPWGFVLDLLLCAILVVLLVVPSSRAFWFCDGREARHYLRTGRFLWFLRLLFSGNQKHLPFSLLPIVCRILRYLALLLELLAFLLYSYTQCLHTS